MEKQQLPNLQKIQPWRLQRLEIQILKALQELKKKDSGINKIYKINNTKSKIKKRNNSPITILKNWRSLFSGIEGEGKMINTKKFTVIENTIIMDSEAFPVGAMGLYLAMQSFMQTFISEKFNKGAFSIFAG